MFAGRYSYPTAAAFRKARIRGTLPVAEFDIAGRRGRFALTQEVARWLVAQRFSVHQTVSKPGENV